MKKLFKTNVGEWKWLVFSKQEESDIRQKHRENSVEIYKQCLEDAKKIMGTDSNLAILETAAALFNKRCDAIYSVLSAALDDAVHDKQVNKS